MTHLINFIGHLMVNLKRVTSSAGKTDGIVRKAWLLGVGVCVIAFEEIQTQFTKINNGNARLFNELVAKGEEYNAVSTDTVSNEVREETAVEKRVVEVRKQLGLDSKSNQTKIAELSQRVDELTQALNKLS